VSRAAVVVAIAAALAACNRSPAREKDKQDEPAPVTVPADWASRGPVTTSVASGPRDTWPCKLEGTLQNDITDGAERVERVYRHDGGPEQCRIPVDMADDGIVGCPTSREITNVERGFTIESRYRYDDAGRMTGVALGKLGWTTYRWDGDTVLGSRAEDDEFTKPGVLDELRVVGDQVHYIVLGETMLQVWLHDGHVAYSHNDGAGGANTVHTWDGGRLVSIESTGTVLNETSRLRAVPCK
jgi:hypothetical protein